MSNLPHRLSHSCSLVLLPSNSTEAPIEAIRSKHDDAAHLARWPPHITLLYPFLANASIDQELDYHPSQGTAVDAQKTSESDAAEYLSSSSNILDPNIRHRIEKAVTNIQPFLILLRPKLDTFGNPKRRLASFDHTPDGSARNTVTTSHRCMSCKRIYKKISASPMPMPDRTCRT